MKKIRGLFAATMLLMILSVSVAAGDIDTNAVPPPPPPPSATGLGHITTGEPQNAIESETLIPKIALSLLQLLAGF